MYSWHIELGDNSYRYPVMIFAKTAFPPTQDLIIIIFSLVAIFSHHTEKKRNTYDTIP